MNKIQTLIKCRNLWAWLAITGSAHKDSYKPSRRYAFNCICCQHAGAILTKDNIDTGSRDCRKCLLNGYAWESRNRQYASSCEHGESLYCKWTACHYSQRSFWAMRMVRACDKAIEDLIVGKLQ